MKDEMNKQTPREKQEASLKKWASGEGIPFPNDNVKTAYQERAGLIADAIRMSPSIKRVPVAPLTTFGPTMIKGISGKKAMYDPEALGQAYLDFCTTYEPDASGAPAIVMNGPPLETLKYELYKWPGHGAPEEHPYQFNEKEYMKADEYDHLISDPTDFWLRSWMPKTHKALEPLSMLPSIFGSMELPMFGPWLATMGAPPVQEALQALMKAGQQCFEWLNRLMPIMEKIIGSGFPYNSGGFAKAPFDVLSDSLRGTAPMMMDLYREPEKVLTAVERLVQPMVNTGVEGTITNNNPLIFIPLHKGADGFMSDEQFKKFYWPTLKAVMYGIAEAGAIPVCFVEGGYNQRLEYLSETSDILCMYIFDRTDMGNARKLLSGKVSIGGGFPISLILTGTPDQVKDETKKLLDTAAGDKGYLLSIGCVLDDARHDTLDAFMKAGREYGIY